MKKNSGLLKSIMLVLGIIILLMVPFSVAQAASPPAASSWPDFPAIWALIEPRLVVLLVLTVFDFLFGTILAIIAKEFKWDYLLHYLNSDILPILAWMAVAFISTIPAEFIPQGALPIFEVAVYTTVFLSIVASLIGHFQKIGVLKRVGGVTSFDDRFPR
ncbi:MAG: hypothetical protein A2136_05550 [Chloroflexi bacterium RBG_16_54_11]|nr:MAG: hypothetical protein A2136_05550 [Chloroflexi bacterium RBG_16_54_11]